VKYKPPQPQSYSAETAALITQLKDRIQRLEEAGDAMASILNNTRKDWYTSDQCEVSAFNWTKAKEAKL
jgi:hypothetical protein